MQQRQRSSSGRARKRSDLSFCTHSIPFLFCSRLFRFSLHFSAYSDMKTYSVIFPSQSKPRQRPNPLATASSPSRHTRPKTKYQKQKSKPTANEAASSHPIHHISSSRQCSTYIRYECAKVGSEQRMHVNVNAE
jgi:hypothetical protein